MVTKIYKYRLLLKRTYNLMNVSCYLALLNLNSKSILYRWSMNINCLGYSFIDKSVCKEENYFWKGKQ